MNSGSRAEAPLSVNDALSQLLHQLGMDRSIPAGQDERAAMFRSRISGRRVLVVLDNAGDSEQVAHLLPGDDSCAVIITCHRPPPSIPSTLSIKLECVTPEVGTAILQEFSGRNEVEIETPAGRKTVRLCDGIPLAITVIGRKLAARPYLDVEDLTRELEDEGTRLQALSYEGVGVAAGYEPARMRGSRAAYRSSPAPVRHRRSHGGVPARPITHRTLPAKQRSYRKTTGHRRPR